MISLLKRLKRKNSWIRIISKSGHTYNGQIASVCKKKIILEFMYTKAKDDMRIHLLINAIESIETLQCENPEVWTK